MREWAGIIFSFVALAFVCYFIFSFDAFLERHENEVNPITPVTWTIRRPHSIYYLRIVGACPALPLQTDKFIACRERLRRQMFRTDV